MDTPKQLGLKELISLVTGNMVGSGIFLLPSSLAAIGSISLLSWSLTTLGAIFLALMFATLSIHFPQTGGPYLYTRAVLGRFLGFQTAYCYWLAAWVGNAAIVLAFVGYASVFFPVLQNPFYACICAIATIWILTIVNCYGVYLSGQVQWITTALKLIPIFFVGFLGWNYIHYDNFTHFLNITSNHQNNFQAIISGAALTFWAFIGLESATIPTSSAINPKRNIPLATILGTLLAALGYILSSAVIMGMIPAPLLQQDTAPFASATNIIIGLWGQYFIALGAIIACLGCLNGWILLQGQVPMSAAIDGLFPKLFANKNKYDIPSKGIILTSVLISFLLLMTTSANLVKQFEKIILLAVLATLIPYFYTCIAHLMLLLQGRIGITYKKFHMLLSLLTLTFVVLAIISTGHEAIYYGCMLLLSSVPLYALIKKDSSEV